MDILNAEYPVRIERIKLSLPDGDEVLFARIDKAKADVPKVLEMCGNVDANERAMTQTYGKRTGVSWSGEVAVYVVACESDKASKVGFSHNPRQRLEALQVGSAERLRVTHLFWMPKQTALAVERLILDIMKHRGHRAMGEWVANEHHRVADAVATLLSMSDASFSDSEMMCQNLRNIRALSDKFDEHATRGWMRKDPEAQIIERLDRH